MPGQEDDDAGRDIDGEVHTLIRFRAGDRDPHAVTDRLFNHALIWRIDAAISLTQGKARGDAVAQADHLIERGHRNIGHGR
jgi:hypothetical protein